MPLSIHKEPFLITNEQASFIIALGKAVQEGREIKPAPVEWVKAKAALGMIRSSQAWHLKWLCEMGYVRRKKTDARPTYTYCPEDLKAFIDSGKQLPKHYQSAA